MDNNYRVEIATEEHVPYLAQHMRETDRKELWLSAMVTPYSALIDGVERSAKAFTTFTNDKPCIMCGVSTSGLLGKSGVIWMLAAENISDIKFTRKEFATMKGYVDDLISEYREVENYVHVENTGSIKWLKYLGFTIEEASPYGYYNQPFMHFYKRNH